MGKANRRSLLSASLVAWLTLILTLGLVACHGGNTQQDAEKDTPSVTGEDAPSEDITTEPPAPTEAPTTIPAEPSDDTDPSVVTPTEAPTEPATEPETFAPYADADNAKTINLAAALANKVTGYYATGDRTAYIIQNQNAYLYFDMSQGNSQIALLADPDGHPYLTDTSDAFVRLQDGTVLYASASDARANLYDQGFYYYDVHILDQSFLGAASYNVVASIDPARTSGVHMTGKVVKNSDGNYEYKVLDATDPYICYNGFSYDASAVDAVVITLRSTISTNGNLFYIAGNESSYNASQNIAFSCAKDGAFHSIVIPLSSGTDYTKQLTGIRLDIGTTAGEVIQIKDIQLVKFKDGIPRISLDRNLIAYSDKINDIARFLSYELSDGIAVLGKETRINADTVEKLIIKDKDGLHTSLSEADQASIEYVGFDIKDAGVLGYILLPHEESGTLTLTLSDGQYVLTQSLIPAGGKMAKDTEYFVGHRLYTDSAHSFDAFLYEAECERHPLENVTVTNQVNGKTYYAGYNALRGVYEFMVENGGSFSVLYNQPDRKFPVTFEITGATEDRRIYVFAHTTNGCLECAAVLDEQERMLPIRVEVCKNFAHDGEELFYTYGDSISYGYAIFPMVVEKEHTEKLTVVHLYERWGLFRLKQLSSIRFHQAYYHQSLGVTETNCISFYNYGNRLPDHRALSQPYWGDTYFYKQDANGDPVGAKTCYSDQPQHENNGTHTFLQYTDAAGTSVQTESRYHVIDASGPTYYDLTMHYVTTDGRMTAAIRMAEMPQYDENRAYSQLDYRVLETVEIKNFRNNFEIYALTSNRSATYTKLGYLNGENQSVIVDANSKSKAKIYVLGDQYPYFDYFKLPDPDPSTFDWNDVYSNVSTLIRGWDIVIGGQTYEGPLILVEKNGRAALTLDLDDVTLLPGDYIKLDLIFMPWGDGTCEDDDNVRLTRQNTLVFPIQTSSDTDIVLTSDPWIPKVRSKNGTTAIFTVSGGLDNIIRDGYASEGATRYKTYYDRDFNVVARVYGLTDFGKAAVYELIDGGWVYLDLSSESGYDGYAILYDEDNSFSVSFVINMNDAQPRTFMVRME